MRSLRHIGKTSLFTEPLIGQYNIDAQKKFVASSKMPSYGSISWGQKVEDSLELKKRQTSLLVISTLCLFGVSLIVISRMSLNSRESVLMSTETWGLPMQRKLALHFQLRDFSQKASSLCGVVACAKEGCDNKLFFSCMSAPSLQRLALLKQRYPSLDLISGELGDLPDEADNEVGELGNLPPSTVATDCGAGACDPVDGCSDDSFFACMLRTEKEKQTNSVLRSSPFHRRMMFPSLVRFPVRHQILAKIDAGELSGLPDELNLLTGELGGLPADPNLIEGELAHLPAEKNLIEGELGNLPKEANLVEGELSGLPAEKNLVEGELSGLPAEPNLVEGELSGLPAEPNLVEGELSGLPAEANLIEGELGSVKTEPNILIGELGTLPEEANLDIGELGALDSAAADTDPRRAMLLLTPRRLGSRRRLGRWYN